MFIFFIILFLLVLKGYFVLDPDFGWYLQMGNLIRRIGIPKTDPFSYTMPGYPVIDHEWLSNVIISIVYSCSGMMGLVLVFVCLAVFSLYLQTRQKTKGIDLIILLTGVSVIISFFGVRVQVVSWFFFSLFVYILRKDKKNKLFILLPLFLLWVNMHGGFILGPVLFFFYFLDKYIKTKKITVIKKGVFVILIIILLSGLNPYGFRLVVEMIRQTASPSLHLYISEWKPFYMIINIPFYLYSALVIMFLLKNRKTVSLFNVFLFVFLFSSALSSVRNFPLWIIGSMYFLLVQIDGVRIVATKVEGGVKRYAFFDRCLQLFLLLCVFLQVLIGGGDFYKFATNKVYPSKAVLFLKQKNLKGELFSVYGWGGYLIWHYPEKKVFIDGRMPSWSRNASSKQESNNAFEEWRNIISGKIKIKEVQKKYNIEAILVPTTQKMYVCKNPAKLEYFFQGLVGRESEKDVFKNLKIIYQDNVATIYLLD